MADDATENARWLLQHHVELKHLGDKALASDFGVAPSTISRLRAARHQVRLKTLQGIADRCDLTVGKFYAPHDEFVAYVRENSNSSPKITTSELRLDCTEAGRNLWSIAEKKYRGNYLSYNRVGEFGNETHYCCALLKIKGHDKFGIIFEIINIDTRTKSKDGTPQTYNIEGRMYPVGEFLAFAGEEDGNLSPVFLILSQTSSTLVTGLHGFILAVGRSKGVGRSMARSVFAQKLPDMLDGVPDEIGVFPIDGLPSDVADQLAN